MYFNFCQDFALTWDPRVARVLPYPQNVTTVDQTNTKHAHEEESWMLENLDVRVHEAGPGKYRISTEREFGDGLCARTQLTVALQGDSSGRFVVWVDPSDCLPLGLGQASSLRPDTRADTPLGSNVVTSKQGNRKMSASKWQQAGLLIVAPREAQQRWNMCPLAVFSLTSLLFTIYCCLFCYFFVVLGFFFKACLFIIHTSHLNLATIS